MAGSLCSEIEDKFIEAEHSINSVLDVPIRLLTERKQSLLSEVALLRGEYNKVKSDKEGSIEELKNSKEELKCIAGLMKENQTHGELEKAIHNMEERIVALELEKPNPPEIKFQHSAPDLKQIEALIGSFGKVECQNYSQIQTTPDGNIPQPAKKSIELIEKTPIQNKKPDPPLKSRDYSAIKAPQTKLTRFGKGTCEFLDPGYIHIDDKNGCIYICDGGKGRVQVWTLDGEYSHQFGSKHLVSPVGITICGPAIFVTDFFKQIVVKFNLPDHSYAEKRRAFSYPHGIDSENDEIFVTEPFKHRISVQTPDLEHIRTLGLGVLKKCYGIKVRGEVLYASEYNTNTIKLLHAQTGDLIRSIPTNKDGESLFNATYFSMDVLGNFFLTDMVADQLKILSPDGELIGGVHFKKWKSHEPKGVAVTPDRKLFIGFGDGENSILII